MLIPLIGLCPKIGTAVVIRLAVVIGLRLPGAVVVL